MCSGEAVRRESEAPFSPRGCTCEGVALSYRGRLLPGRDDDETYGCVRLFMGNLKIERVRANVDDFPDERQPGVGRSGFVDPQKHDLTHEEQPLV